MQSIAASLSASKDDSQIAQKGQEARSELSGVSLDVPAASSRTLTQAATTPAAETAVLKNPSQDFSEQLGSALRAGLDRSDKQLVVRLHPPELGSVLVRFEEQGQQIKAVLEVSRSETGREIEQALPQVIRNLQDAGLHIRRFDVVVSDQLGKDAGTSSSSHDAWNQQGQGQRTESEGQRTEDGADRRHPSAIFHRPSPIPQQGRMDVLL